MRTRRLLWLAIVPALALAAYLPSRADKPTLQAPSAAWFVDDEALFNTFNDKLATLANQKKCLPAKQLQRKVAVNRTCKLTLTKPGTEKLDPETIYQRALPSVFIIGSVVEDDDGDYLDGRMATAWVLAADGVLVTNWHVFDKVEDDEVYGVMDHRGHVYPLTDVLAMNKTADIAIFRIAATGLTPLPVAERPAAVGSWVGVLGHPGDRYFTFTQGAVTRYTTMKRDDGVRERWLSITADYAYGSSGSPVLDRHGAVIGMAALTENIDYPADDTPPDPAKKDAAPVRKESLLQMVVKLTTSATELRKMIEGE